MQLYIQTAFVCLIAPVRFASSSPLVLLKSNVSKCLMEVEKKTQPKPEKATRGKKTAVLGLRLTPEDKVLMQAKAKEAGHNTNEFIRRAALGLEVKQKLPAELKRVLSATSKNLNQYLKLAHMGRLNGVDEDALGGIIQALNQALR